MIKWLLPIALCACKTSFALDAPHVYQTGDPVSLYANKLSSIRAVLPMSYYSLPFCQLPNNTQVKQNFGEHLRNNEFWPTPYRVQMKKDIFCEQLCISNVGRGEQKGVRPNRVVRAIQEGYGLNFQLDGIPAASRSETDDYITTRFSGNVPLGFLSAETQEAYIYNHLNIQIMFRENEGSPGSYRILRLTVQPFSIAHQFEPISQAMSSGEASIRDPIQSCRATSWEDTKHTSYDMVIEKANPQIASGKVLFTYDVIWLQNQELPWSARWDIYLSMDDATPLRVHWMGLSRSLLFSILFLTFPIVTIVSQLKASSQRGDEDIETSTNEPETQNVDKKTREQPKHNSWRELEHHALQPPLFHPGVLASCCGMGAQIFATIVVSVHGLVFSVELIKTGQFGLIVVACLILYVAMGVVGGYVAGRFCHMFHVEDSWSKSFLWTTTFPTFALFIWLAKSLISVVADENRVFVIPPLSAHFGVLGLYIGVICCLAIGFNVGLKSDSNRLSFPEGGAREIPKQPFHTRFPFLMLLGVFPFSCIFVEFSFLLSSTWKQQSYAVFGFLMLTINQCIVLTVISSVVGTYVLLYNEDYRWWWRSFAIGGSVGIYVFVDLCLFATGLGFVTGLGFLVYGLFAVLLSFAVALAAGFVGASASFFFQRKLFASIKAQ